MTIRSRRRLVLCFLIYGSVLLGQSPAVKDLDGWTKAKWGMSEQEITAAFAPDVKTTPRLGLDDVQVENLHFSARFLMDGKSSRLSGVSLTCLDNKVSPASFWALEKALIKQYGEPLHRSNGTRLTTAWEFASSSIEMHYSESPLIGRYLVLNYSKRAGQEDGGKSK